MQQHTLSAHLLRLGACAALLACSSPSGEEGASPLPTQTAAAPVAAAVASSPAKAAPKKAEAPKPIRRARFVPQAPIEVVIDGVAKAWSPAALAGVSVLDIQGDGGGDRRDAWSLRQLVHELVGKDAVVVSVVAEGEESVSIENSQWADDHIEPVLRLNRRGILKFHWVDRRQDMAPMEEGDSLRGVEQIVVRSKSS